MCRHGMWGDSPYWTRQRMRKGGWEDIPAAVFIGSLTVRKGQGNSVNIPLWFWFKVNTVCTDFSVYIHLHPGLKRQSHEIFDLHFFHKLMAPRALINTLKYFLILFRFRAEINEFILTCIARSRDSALCNIARSFSNFISSKTSRYTT
jgi:hypothetical protein